MFIFSSFILFYIAIFGYTYAKAHLKPLYSPSQEFTPLTKKEFTYIKKNLLKLGLKNFPPSKAIQERDISDFTGSMLSDLFESYKNIQEWSYKEVGDVLYILNIKPSKTTRSYSKNIKCFHILFDEFIHYAHYHLVPFKTEYEYMMDKYS